LFLELNVDLDPDLSQQSRERLDVDLAVLVSATLDDLLDLVEDLQLA
jgi:hypothetical protein